MAEENLKADVIVVGSGPGGATVARGLAQRGVDVLLLERGRDHRGRWYYGTYPGAMLYADKGSFLFTTEGLNIVRPLMVGGATSMYCGCAADPPDWFKTKYGIDLTPYVQQIRSELKLAPLPAELRGAASTRLAEAGKALGYDWFPQEKFMWPERTKKFRCGARCMLGCRCGAKWNAGEFVDEAQTNGARLLTGARVIRVDYGPDGVIGVYFRHRSQERFAAADTVILAAGGIGTPRLLQSSGLQSAGQGMTMDTTVMVYGFDRHQGIGKEPPMTWSWENLSDGYMLSTLLDPWLLYPLIAARSHWTRFFTWYKWNRVLGVMIKLKDEISGGVFPDGRISKPLTNSDLERLQGAEELCRRILIEAGADSAQIFRTPLRGTHPSGTVRLGEMLDDNLQTRIKGLYVCDASVFPEALARPTVLTIQSLALRLVDHLTGHDGKN